MLSFSAKFAYDLIQFAARLGMDPAPLWAETGLSSSDSSREDVRVSAGKLAKVWQAAIEQTGEPYLALKMGLEQYSAQQTATLIMGNSLTVREAFEQAMRYGRLIANVMTVTLQNGSEADSVALQFDLHPLWELEDPAVTLDCLLIAMMSAARSIGAMTGVNEPPERVTLQRARLDDASTVHECFARPVELSAEVNAVVFRESVLSREVEQPNPGLQAAIRSYADGVFRSLASSSGASFGEEVRQRLTGAIPHRIGLPEMARQLKMSPRTLQRKLEREGLVYRRMVEQVHVQCAHHYLITSNLPLDEVAFLAGYSDAPSLIRAYKRHYPKLPRRASVSPA